MTRKSGKVVRIRHTKRDRYSPPRRQRKVEEQPELPEPLPELTPYTMQDHLRHKLPMVFLILMGNVIFHAVWFGRQPWDGFLIGLLATALFLVGTWFYESKNRR